MGKKPKKVALATLGCKINQCDTKAIAEEIKSKGYQIVPFCPDADIFIINTCTVTGRTDYKARQLIRKACLLNPSAILVATGCYAQVQAGEIAKIPGIDYIFGNAEKEIIASSLDTMEKLAVPEVAVSEEHIQAPLEVSHLCSYSGHTRAFLKVQDGCNESCTYCIIPRARGRSRSLPPDRILEQIAGLASKGLKEVVLCGIHLGHYGYDISPQTHLLSLLERIEKQAAVPRVRISSIEPNEIHDDLLSLFAEAHHLCPHFHLPMQSGDPKVLQAMHRRYMPGQFQTLVYHIRTLIPDAAIGVDVIVGFPGEGKVEFKNTRDLVASMPVTYLHVFPYSNRPRTIASGLPDQVAAEDIQERSLILRDLGKEKRRQFYTRFLARSMEVLVESNRDPESNLLKGFSRNYIPILFPGEDSWKNQAISVKIDEVQGIKVLGSIADKEMTALLLGDQVQLLRV